MLAGQLLHFGYDLGAATGISRLTFSKLHSFAFICC